MVWALMEILITLFSRSGRRVFFDANAFPWVADTEAEWKAIRKELDALLVERSRIPNFQDILADQKVLTEGEQWKSFFFYAAGERADENCARCPETERALRRIPGMQTAFFSILAPGKHIPPHRGMYKGVLRYHLGLIIPEPKSSCRIRIRDEIHTWKEGKSLIFDDTYQHEAWNDSDAHRVVLFVDFTRPLPFPLSALNEAILRRFSRSSYIQTALARVRSRAVAADTTEPNPFG